MLLDLADRLQLDPARLPIGCAPQPDETLRSALTRLAWNYRTTQLGLLAHLGLTTPDRRAHLGFGIVIDQPRMEMLCARSGMTEDSVRDSLVGDLFARVTGQRLPDEPTHRDLFRYGRHWVFVSGTRFCPQCLAESDGVWRRSWRLPWTFMCLRHGCLLESRCAACDGEMTRADLTRPPKWSVPPGVCPLRVSNRSSQTRGHRPICGHPLAEQSAERVQAGSPLLAVQMVFNHFIDAGTGQILGREVPVAEYFREVRSLTALVLRGASAEDIAIAVPESAEAFARWEPERRAVQAGSTGQVGRTRLRARAVHPGDAGLIGGCAAFAADLLADTPEHAADTHAWLAERLGWPSQRVLTSQYSLSPDVAAALARHREEPDRRTQRRLAWHLRCGTVGFEPQHVPMVMWREAWEGVFEHLLLTRRELPVRLFLSGALVKCAFDLTWAEAAEALGLPSEPAGRWRMYAAKIAGLDLHDSLIDGLTRTAEALSSAPFLIDYRSRATEVRDIDVLPSGTWERICARAGVHAGKGARQRNAETWLFSELTGEPLRNARAALRDRDSDTLWENYVRFYREELPPLHRALHAEAERLALELEGARAAGVERRRVLRCLLPRDFV